jgi:hypothetical protein
MRSVKKSYFSAAHAREKKHDRKICDEENPAFPGGSTVVEPAETRFSKIPDFRGMNPETQSVTVIEPAEISAGKKAPGKRTAGRR